MFRKRNENGSSMDAGKSKNRILRLFRSDTGFAASLVSLEGKDQESVYEDYQKVRNTMLEVEFAKAQTLMAYQQNRQRFC